MGNGGHLLFLCEHFRFVLKLATTEFFFFFNCANQMEHVCELDLVMTFCFVTSGLDDARVLDTMR